MRAWLERHSAFISLVPLSVFQGISLNKLLVVGSHCLLGRDDLVFVQVDIIVAQEMSHEAAWCSPVSVELATVAQEVLDGLSHEVSQDLGIVW